MWRLQSAAWGRSREQKPLYGDLLERACLQGEASVADLDELCGYLGWKPKYGEVDFRHET